MSTTSRPAKAPSRAPSRRDDAEPTNSTPPSALPFAGLAYLHYRWRKALESNTPNLDSAERA